MAKNNQPPRGTYDLLPDDAGRLSSFLRRAVEILERAGFREIETPLLEEETLFHRTSGAASDIVSKEMYRLAGGGPGGPGAGLVLRPEGTAPVVRAYLDNFHRRNPAGRFYYWGPMFRYNRPQKGRYRQFLQLGAEVFGAPAPWVDAECLALAVEIVAAAGGGSDWRALVNTLGCRDCQAAYRVRLAEYLGRETGALCPDCLARLERNPLRALDCKNPACRPVLARAPEMDATRCPDCRLNFEQVLDCCRMLGVECVVEPRLVRGLDYYTRTVFEIVPRECGSAVAAGGRYDCLVSDLGGRPTPALGFALGLERLLGIGGPQACPAGTRRAGVRLVHLDDEGEKTALAAALHLLAGLRRETGLPVTMSGQAGRKLKNQLESADRDGCRFAVIIGARELADGIFQVRDLATGGQAGVREAEIAAHVTRQSPGIVFEEEKNA